MPRPDRTVNPVSRPSACSADRPLTCIHVAPQGQRLSALTLLCSKQPSSRRWSLSRSSSAGSNCRGRLGVLPSSQSVVRPSRDRKCAARPATVETLEAPLTWWCRWLSTPSLHHLVDEGIFLGVLLAAQLILVATVRAVGHRLEHWRRTLPLTQRVSAATSSQVSLHSGSRWA